MGLAKFSSSKNENPRTPLSQRFLSIFPLLLYFFSAVGFVVWLFVGGGREGKSAADDIEEDEEDGGGEYWFGFWERE